MRKLFKYGIHLVASAVFAIVLIGVTANAGTAAIIDNNDVGFNVVGGWGTSSSVAGYYGSDYRFARAGDGSLTAAWSFVIDEEAQYSIYAQWTSHPTLRASDAPYTIYLNGVAIETVLADQRADGGQFNLLGTYTLVPGTLEVVLTNDASNIVVADAVQVVNTGLPVNAEPNGVIDTPATDATITAGESVDFSGTGSDLDGDLPLAFNWNFDDPAIADSSSEAPGSVQFNNPGTFTVTFTVTDAEGLADSTPAVVNITVLSNDISVIDNTNSNFSVSGSWGTSTSASGYYGDDYLFAPAGDGSLSATWSFVIDEEAQYSIYAQWTSHPTLRAFDAPYTIYLNGTALETVLVDQRTDGGQFNLLGSYTLAPGTLEVVLTNDASNIVVADAVQVVNNGPPVNDISVIDNNDVGFNVVGGWGTSTSSDGYYGSDYRFARAGDGSLTATWSFVIDGAGQYEIAAQWASSSNRSIDARYIIFNNGIKLGSVILDQTQNGFQFVSLGSYNVDVGALEIQLTNAASKIVDDGALEASYVVADAMQVMKVGNNPNLTIHTPSDLSIVTSPDVTVKAIAINYPADWKTEFVIDGDFSNSIKVNGSTMILDPSTYTALAGLSYDEHIIQARMLDSTDAPQTALIEMDFGVGYYNVSFGDSITEALGSHDQVFYDDISADGRNSGGGYQPILNDLLTSNEGRPQTVENEGIGGEESIDGLARVYSLLAAHPDAQRIFILFGTNDSSGSMPVPSGVGLGTPALGTFEHNMQKIIDAIDPVGTGRIPVIAKVPMRFGDSSKGPSYADPESHPRNLLIEDYNTVIDELKALNPMIEIMTGPPLQSDNFFTYFRDLPRTNGIPTEFSDNLHPNGIGNQSMARLWCEALTGLSCEIAP